MSDKSKSKNKTARKGKSSKSSKSAKPASGAEFLSSAEAKGLTLVESKRPSIYRDIAHRINTEIKVAGDRIGLKIPKGVTYQTFFGRLNAGLHLFELKIPKGCRLVKQVSTDGKAVVIFAKPRPARDSRERFPREIPEELSRKRRRCSMEQAEPKRPADAQ